MASPPQKSTASPTFPWPPQPDFLHLFKAFRLAINPTQLIIALLAIVLIYMSGRAFDGIWGRKVYQGEIESYRDSRPEQYAQLRASKAADQSDQLQYLLLRADPSIADNTDLKQDPDAAFRAIKRASIQKFHDRINEIQTSPPSAFASPGDPSPADEARHERETLASALQSDIMEAKAAAGKGIFDSLMHFEIFQFDALVENTLSFVRLTPMVAPQSPDFTSPLDNQALAGGLFSRSPDRFYRSDTILGCVANMVIIAPGWLFTGTQPMQWKPDVSEQGSWKGWIKIWFLHRLPYLFTLIILVAFWFVVLALAGAMICRLSALQFTGAANPSIKPVLTFTCQKFGTFLKAPTMPFIIVLCVGLLLGLIGVAGAIPFIGELIIGVLFIVLLLGGFIMMLMLLGVVGGFHMLFPTIAVEGSDAFDALSRAFAYAYAKPWKLLFYTLVSLVYGILTYLFVAFAIYLVLGLTHFFVGNGMSLFGHIPGWYNGAPKLETLWPTPHLFDLSQQTNWWAMSWTEYFGAILISFWTYLVISVQGAFVLSFYFSAHTIIYLLLRKSVDGQTITDIYLEEAPPVSDAPAPAAPATEPPPAEAVPTP